MVITNNFPVSIEVGSTRYVLSRSELRAIDSREPNKSYSVALNELNPNYVHHFKINPLALLGMVYFAGGFIYNLYLFLSATAGPSDNPLVFMLLSGGLLIYACYGLYRGMKMKPCFYFHSLTQPGKAYAVMFNRRNRTNAIDFVNQIAKRIREAPLSNLAIVNLLGSYHLLTQIEWAQLDANVKQKEVRSQPTEPVIINLHHRKS